MAVLLNGIAQLEFDRNKPLPEHQALYLEINPDINQRAQFVAANLVHAIKSDEEAKAASLCTYLAIRLPELKQVKINDTHEEVTIDLVFDEDYKNQVAVQFKH